MASNESLDDGTVLVLLDILVKYPRGIAAQYLAELHNKIRPDVTLPENFESLLEAHSKFYLLEDVVYTAIDDDDKNIDPQFESDKSPKRKYMKPRPCLVIENNNVDKAAKKVSINASADRIVYSPVETEDQINLSESNRLLIRRTMAAMQSPVDLGRICLDNRPVLTKGAHRVLVTSLSTDGVFYVIGAEDVVRRQHLWDDLAVNYEMVGVTADRFLNKVVIPSDLQIFGAFVCIWYDKTLRRVYIEDVNDVTSLPSMTSIPICNVRCFDSGETKHNVVTSDLRYCAPDVHDHYPLATRCIIEKGSNSEILIDQICEINVEGQSSSRVSIMKYERTCTGLAPNLRPIMLNGDLTCTVLHVENAHEIYVQLDRAEPAPALVRSMLCDVHADSFKTTVNVNYDIGDYVCIRLGSNFERGVIIAQEVDRFRCFLVDVGAVKMFSRNSIVPLSPKVNSVFKEGFAVQVSLSNLHVEQNSTNQFIVNIICESTITSAIGKIDYIRQYKNVHIPVIFGDLITKSGDSITSLIIDRFRKK